MQQTSIDDVPALWEEGPAPLTVALVFGVGARHETFRTAGVTHLIEHLAMGALPKSPVDSNAEVRLDTTIFHATGRPELVVDFIHRVCAALSDLPVDRLDREAGVLRAEGATAVHPAVAVSLVNRYGVTAQGLAGAVGPGPDQISRDMVVAHAARFFTRGNAVLVLTGPPPEGLHVSLPDGPRAGFPVAPPLDLPLPAYLVGSSPFAALTGVTPLDVGPALGAILTERVTDELRHKEGVAYDIGSAGERIDYEHGLLAVWSDGHEDKMDLVARTMWETLGRLAADGPTAEELAHTRAVLHEGLDDPRSVPDWLLAQAARMLRGEPPRTRAAQRQLIDGASPEAIREAAAAVRDGAILLLPEGDYDIPGVPSLDEHEYPSDSLRGEHTYRRRTLSRSPRDLEIRVGESGFSITASGRTGSATWDGIVGVASAEGMRGVVTADGRSFPVIAKSLRDGDRLLERIDALAGERLFASSAEDILG
ncbi:insulinase family protein [Intrasporangium sp.]|uniref:M16 family metallopeptidase n=1 Tax=Intrasporangium sp. TaxID=1925024 RepID=UPI0032221C70